MPDILSVSMQDILHRRKPELRTQQITHGGKEQKNERRFLFEPSLFVKDR